MTPTVTLIQPYVPEYRVPLFESMRRQGESAGLRIEVVAGRPGRVQAARGDAVRPQWLHTVPGLQVPSERLPVRLRLLPPRLVARSALLVTEYAAAPLESYPLALTGKLCLWGHGYGATAPSGPLDEALERWLLRRSRHFFAYTEEGRRHARAHGMPADRITVLDNTVDTGALRRAVAAVTPPEVQAFRDRFGLGAGPVLASIGGLDGSKRLELLLRAAIRLRALVPGLQLLVAGDGVQRALVEGAARDHPWMHYLGRIGDRDKALVAHTARLLLNPGRVGLVAVDSFALGLPVVTTTWPRHAPEFTYLTPANSVVTPDTEDAYVEAVARLLNAPETLEQLRRGCLLAAEHYSIEAMARRFLAGIRCALDRPGPVASHAGGRRSG